jgi:hypothetical protein
MIRCNECHALQYDGALFCSECGKSLVSEPHEEVDILPFTERPPRMPQALPPDCKLAFLAEPKSVVFMIPQKRQRRVVELTDQILIGRAGRELDDVPELDLSEQDGIELGVSRTHAAIQWSNYGLVLLDLGSTNGTLLNNTRLPAKRPFRLHSGDEIRFGNLLVHIFFD